MATVPNKDRVAPVYNDRHVLTPAEMSHNAGTGNTDYPGSASANPNYIPRLP
jgi:hypothetical protein